MLGKNMWPAISPTHFSNYLGLKASKQKDFCMVGYPPPVQLNSQHLPQIYCPLAPHYMNAAASGQRVENGQRSSTISPNTSQEPPPGFQDHVSLLRAVIATRNQTICSILMLTYSILGTQFGFRIPITRSRRLNGQFNFYYSSFVDVLLFDFRYYQHACEQSWSILNH